MISYSVCLSLSDLFRLSESPPGPSMLLQMEEVHSWLILLDHDTHFSIPSSSYAKVFIIGSAVGKQTLSNIAGGSINWYNVYEVKLEVSFKITKHTLFDSDIQPLKNVSDTHPSMCLK